MSYLLVIPIVSLAAILVIVGFYLLADLISNHAGTRNFDEEPNGSGKRK